jgi:hypothetical protein
MLAIAVTETSAIDVAWKWLDGHFRCSPFSIIDSNHLPGGDRSSDSAR